MEFSTSDTPKPSTSTSDMHELVAVVVEVAVAFFVEVALFVVIEVAVAFVF